MSTVPATSSTFTDTPCSGGGSSSTVTGSTTKSTTVGVRSALPAVSIAYTANVCDPASSLGVVNGDAQSWKGPESRLHTNRDPGLSDEKVKVGVWSVDGSGRGGVDARLRHGLVDRLERPGVAAPPSGRVKPR